MTREETIEWLARCIETAARGAPMSNIEKAAHRSRCAAEYARAEARRVQPKLQLDLPKVA